MLTFLILIDVLLRYLHSKMSGRVRVTVLGHSFIRRLKDYIDENEDETLREDFGLGCRIKYFGQGGSTIRQLLTREHRSLLYFRPDIVICQIAGNDLGRDRELNSSRDNSRLDSSCGSRDFVVNGDDDDAEDEESTFDKESLMDDVREFVSNMKRIYGASQVILCKIFVRTRPRYISAKEYERRREIINTEWEKSFNGEAGVYYWDHDGLADEKEGIFLDDGVHLNEDGMKQFYFSLGRGVRDAVDRFNERDYRPRVRHSI